MKQLLFALLLLSIATKAQTINTIAGSGPTGFMTGAFSGDGGPGTSALLNNPCGLVFDQSDNLIICDGQNGRLRRLSPAGVITTIAGGGTAGLNDGGPAIDADLGFPTDAVFDKHGNLYVADQDNMLIRKIDPSGIITTIAGSGTGSALGDGGPAISATFNTPIYLSFDATGNLYVCDWGNSRVRKIDTAGIITTVAGIGTNTYSGDSGPAVSAGLSVSGLLIDHSGNILVCDATNGRIRKIDTTGIITTFVSGLNFPCCMVGDNSGNIYVNNEDAQTIVKIDTSGAMTVVAGTGVEDFSGDGGPAIDAAFGYPSGITIDSCNNLYISDLWNNRVRQISYEPACNKFNSLGVSNTIISNSIIYPNPASDVLTISTGIKIGQISISDMFDQTLLTKTCNASKVEIDISKLPAGVYFVTINGPDSYREVSKFLKE